MGMCKVSEVCSSCTSQLCNPAGGDKPIPQRNHSKGVMQPVASTSTRTHFNGAGRECQRPCPSTGKNNSPFLIHLGEGSLNSRMGWRGSSAGETLQNECSCKTLVRQGLTSLPQLTQRHFHLFCASEQQNLPSRVQMMAAIGVFIFWHQK